MAPARVAETERLWKSVRTFVMVLGKVPEMDQKSEFAATLATACAKVQGSRDRLDVEIWDGSCNGSCQCSCYGSDDGIYQVSCDGCSLLRWIESRN